MSIKVAVVGANGRMGRAITEALVQDPEFAVTLAVDRTGIGTPIREFAGPKAPEISILERLGEGFDAAEVDVMVDMSHHSAAPAHAESAAKRGKPFVIGCTGLSNDSISGIRSICREYNVPGMIVPNFAIGAILMMKFSEMAARWMPDCEIIELHHDRKEDAPSGTALLTAERIADARVSEPTKLPTEHMKVAGVRGGVTQNVRIHSVRLPGLLAHQQVIFGAKGETLTITHDSLDRASFMAGVKLSVRTVPTLTGLTVGLDKVLFD
jgi:4-hydroxy-tetrahydrodipicolinate reductase